METWHPIIVHLPLVLIPLAVALDLAALVWRQSVWHRQAFGLLWLGVGTAALAVLTGNSAAAAYRQDPALQGLIGAHEDWATWVLLLFTALGLARVPLQLQQQLRSWRFGVWMAAAVAGCLLVGVTGYTGGELVFRYGVGVNVKP